MRALAALAAVGVAAALSGVQPALAAPAATAPLVMQGTAAAGAKVSLYAWPLRANSLRPGQKVPRTLLTTATASRAGAFAMHVPASALAAAAGSRGFINMETVSGTRSVFSVWSQGQTAISAATVSHPAQVSLTAARPATAATPAVCPGWTFVKQMPAQWGDVGEAFVAPGATHVTSTFTYSSGQSSSIGIDLSATGKAGSFRASGAESVSATTVTGFPRQTAPGNYLYRTQFRMAEYREICVTGGNDSIQFMVRSNGYAGGEQIQHPKGVPASGQCKVYLKGGKFQTTTERASQFSSGLSIAGFASFTMQTGYDHSASLLYNFGANRHVCGIGNIAPGAAKNVVVRP